MIRHTFQNQVTMLVQKTQPRISVVAVWTYSITSRISFTFNFYGEWTHLVFFLPFLLGNQLHDLLFTFLHSKPLLKRGSTLKRKNLLQTFVTFFFSFYFPAYHVPSKKESTIKGKHLLPLGANASLLELTPFQKGCKKLWSCLFSMCIHSPQMNHWRVWKSDLYEMLISILYWWTTINLTWVYRNMD